MADLASTDARQDLWRHQLPNDLQKEHSTFSTSGRLPHNALANTLIEPSKPTLSPAPAFLQRAKDVQDDLSLKSPSTTKRPNLAPRGLTLQMPTRDTSSTSTNLLTSHFNTQPLSPKLDPSLSYTSSSPGSAIPRNRDFARSCTNLHHSTLAEQSSPDSSPVIGGRVMHIPRGKNFHHFAGPDSPGFPPSSLWSTPVMDKSNMASSLGSVSMLDSESDSDSSDDDMMREEDAIQGTPHGNGLALLGTFPSTLTVSPGTDGMRAFLPSRTSLMSFRRRLRHRTTDKSRKSSSSASARSSLYSPAPSSPPIVKSIESNLGTNYFSRDLSGNDMQSRRESLSLGTDEMHISDTPAGTIERNSLQVRAMDTLGQPIPVTPTWDERRNVIRRAVTRRSNMLPKPKGFARIRAALQEEGSPVDSESKREAEVIRQVRENEVEGERCPFTSQSTSRRSSPSYLPSIASGQEENHEDDATDSIPPDRRSSGTFSEHALKHSTPDFWKRAIPDAMRTPPTTIPRHSSSTFSEDMNVDTPATSVISSTPFAQPPHIFPNLTVRSRSSTPQPSMAHELTRKLGKRRRDDDLDPYLFKRRAVSPGVSLQNSPILPPSPARGEGGWRQAKSNRETSQSSSLSVGGGGGGGANNTTTTSNTPRRNGFQKLNEAHDRLMNMNIE